MKIKIITDSTSYLPQHIKKRYNIQVISLSVSFPNESLLEEETDNKAFYKKMDNSPVIPTSSQPNFNDIYRTFEDNLQKGYAIIAIFLSAKMSGTYQTALTVKKMLMDKYPQGIIEIIDSQTNCMEMGFAVIEAAKGAEEGKSLEEITNRAKNMIKKSRFLFAPMTLEYLKKGGRIGGAALLLGSLLQIKPILTVVKGETALLTKVRTSKKAVEKIVQIFLQDIEKYGFGGAVVHHINCEEEGNNLAQYIGEKLGKSIPVYSIGPVIGLHVGPGTMGIAYYTAKDRLD